MNTPSTPDRTWLDTAVFYEIYPQSFADSNGDGIGDIHGIIDHLDYVRNLGCNALWLNPLFDSPFKDAGYDVRDYTRVAPRYGTNDDLVALFAAAHERGIRVLLDLVPGHTSEEHPWFHASSQPNTTNRGEIIPSAAPSSDCHCEQNEGTPTKCHFERSEAESRNLTEAVPAKDLSTPLRSGRDDNMGAGSDRDDNTGTITDHNPTLASRYIWTDSWIAGGDGLPFIGGETPRDGTYIINFFKCQPALNYGFAHPRQSWQHAALGPEALATCDAMVDVMRFWLSRGADGFRVDMADSLVKHDDEGKPATIRTWQYMFSKIRPEFPAAAFVSEWGRPYESMQAGFDMDFYLDWRWDGKPNGYNMLLRNTDTPFDHDGDLSYFNADSGASIKPFLDQYLPQLRDCERAGGLFDLISCNHDTRRFAPRLTERERKIAFGMLLTMPGCPFVYYGDEIGMRYRDLPTKEGGYTRTGSRTPMQWDGDLPNLGFSAAPADALYLPVEPAGDTAHDATGAVSPVTVPTVASESARADSLYHWITSLLALRADSPALRSNAAFEPVAAPESGRVFAYLRTPVDSSGERNESGSLPLLIAMNPGRETETVTLPTEFAAQSPAVRLAIGEPAVDGATLTLPPQSFVILG
ncbi:MULTISPECIES: alpha-amylase family glycosyl hydrolase [Bifidobacterium]|uniref:alpha-amylase family glycosyl hydrolase n=1 Tax=Bifidobacterium TaxID=1678 RepID=UPI001BDC615C|nr:MULTISPECIES: alpha-amylase family glycosyl hydrolase [Bifidobacterium]MBT1161934.1 alpha-amylase [Bifidobacterium sp. SO1]MBW3079471.1 alpha-amylase [Bifidobacterium simiiventris]